MVDSFVVHRQVDHSAETQQGFHLGLWTCKPGSTETADSKKQAYDVFKYMDTKQYMTYTKFALPLIKKTAGNRQFQDLTRRNSPKIRQ